MVEVAGVRANNPDTTSSLLRQSSRSTASPFLLYDSPILNSASPSASNLSSGLLPSPSVVSSASAPMDIPPRRYSRPASLRSFSSSTQVTTITATGSTASSPSTAYFPSSVGFPAYAFSSISTITTTPPAPIPTPSSLSKRATPNYKSTVYSAPLNSTQSSWSLSKSSDRFSPSDLEKSGGSGTRRPVMINVYDMLQNSRVAPVIWTLGIPILHSAVEVDGREYAYGGHEESNISGVYYSKPQLLLPGGISCKVSILHEYTTYSPAEVLAIVNDLSLEFMGTSYNLLHKNCNHFTDALVRRLTDKPVPAWLNRATAIGSAVPCLIPQSYIKPPEPNMSSVAQSDIVDDSEGFESKEVPMPDSDDLSPSLLARCKNFCCSIVHSYTSPENPECRSAGNFIISTRYADDPESEKILGRRMSDSDSSYSDDDANPRDIVRIV
ncbi:PPPDE putative peptidase domain-containing protein [Lipomyces oligophaga]|uniref:PPPDE putative peptidase domain-containing protein n=1 Tax=Lipomyces oligophaga TaxID=45792 RepID=UPI0034CDB006